MIALQAEKGFLFLSPLPLLVDYNWGGLQRISEVQNQAGQESTLGKKLLGTEGEFPAFCPA